MLGPLLPPEEANMGPIGMGPPCLIIKAQLDQAVKPKQKKISPLWVKCSAKRDLESENGLRK